MTFDEIMLIIADKTKTDRQKGADLEAAFLKASNPSVMTLQPQKQRKARSTATPKPRSPASEAVNGFAGIEFWKSHNGEWLRRFIPPAPRQ